jgi:dihydrofolate reductase
MHCFLIAAMTADGYIGRSDTDRSFDWTSEADKKFYVEMIKRAGTVVMGSRTFGTFTRYPKGLHFVVYTSRPDEFVNPKPEVITTQATQLDPQALISQLAAEGREEVAICGGSSVYSMFLKSGVVDTLYLSVEPVLFGQGVPLLSEQLNIDLQLKESRRLSEETLLLEYRVRK